MSNPHALRITIHSTEGGVEFSGSELTPLQAEIIVEAARAKTIKGFTGIDQEDGDYVYVVERPSARRAIRQHNRDNGTDVPLPALVGYTPQEVLSINNADLTLTQEPIVEISAPTTETTRKKSRRKNADTAPSLTEAADHIPDPSDE